MVSISLTSSDYDPITGQAFDMVATLNPNPGAGYTVVFFDTGTFPDTEIYRGTTNAQGQVYCEVKIGKPGTYTFQTVYYPLGPNVPCILSGCIYSNQMNITASGSDTGGGVDPINPNPTPVFDSTLLIYGGIALLAVILLTRR